jgi:hypothetical protein
MAMDVIKIVKLKKVGLVQEVLKLAKILVLINAL